MRTTTLAIAGMSCGHCVAAVRAALAQVPGIEVREVEVGRAVVAAEPGVATAGDLIDAVEHAGYTATVSAA